MIILIHETAPEPCTDKCPQTPHTHKSIEQEYAYCHHVESNIGELSGYVSIPTSALEKLYGKVWQNRDFAAMRIINAQEHYGHEAYIDVWEEP